MDEPGTQPGTPAGDATPDPTADPRTVRDDHVEIEDEGPEPDLDPALEARIRGMLAGAADPGPMPPPLVDRIERALASEAALRVEPGPLTQADHDDAVLTPLIRQRQRPRPLFAAAAIAAAAAVVAVGGSALHMSKRPIGTAALGDPSSVVTSPAAPSATPPVTTPTEPFSTGPTNANLHIQLSRTAYTAAGLPDQTRAMLARPDTPVRVLAAEAPSIGPIATEIGLTACLRELGLPTDVPVHVDIAGYEGEPAAVIAVTRGDTTTVRVVERSCTTGHADLVKDSTPVP